MAKNFPTSKLNLLVKVLRSQENGSQELILSKKDFDILTSFSHLHRVTVDKIARTNKAIGLKFSGNV